jgi:hopene-associated glycosyltransferase HpnB
MIAAEMVSLTSLAFWVLLSLERRRAWPAEMILPETPRGPSNDDVDSVVAIVPARDEAETLAMTLPTLLLQDLEGFRVILVDDDSTDGTGDLARRLGQEIDRDDRFEVMTAGSRREGWSGKVHALSYGYQVILDRAAQTGIAPPEWLLLTDADIRHRPGSVRSLLQQAGRSGAEQSYALVSVMARLRAERFWERIVVPAFVFFFQLLYPFRRVADRRSGVAAAAGGCVLVRRSVFEDAGGFGTISGEIIDDVALGRAIKKTGGGVWLGFDPGIASVRGYSGLSGLWRMVSRTAFTQLRYRWDLLVLTLLALGIFLVAPPVIFAVSLVRLGTSDLGDPGSWLRAAVWAILAWILMSVAYLPAIRHHHVPRSFAVTLPLAGLLFGLMTCGSALDDLRGHGPTWRGRSYEASRESGSRPSR